MFQTTRDDEATLVSFCAASTALFVSVEREVNVMHAETSLWRRAWRFRVFGVLKNIKYTKDPKMLFFCCTADLIFDSIVSWLKATESNQTAK